jgi:hypothetical protein
MSRLAGSWVELPPQPDDPRSTDDRDSFELRTRRHRLPRRNTFYAPTRGSRFVRISSSGVTSVTEPDGRGTGPVPSGDGVQHNRHSKALLLCAVRGLPPTVFRTKLRVDGAQQVADWGSSQPSRATVNRTMDRGEIPSGVAVGRLAPRAVTADPVICWSPRLSHIGPRPSALSNGNRWRVSPFPGAPRCRASLSALQEVAVGLLPGADQASGAGRGVLRWARSGNRAGAVAPDASAEGTRRRGSHA